METEPFGTPRSVTLLGPQRLRPTVGDALRKLGIRDSVAAVTAGWQDYEDEDKELSAHLGGRAVNLNLNRRAREALDEDPELCEALDSRQRQLRDLQRLYRIRLGHALEATRELGGLDGVDQRLLQRGHCEAMEAVRTLDRDHQARVEEVRAGFDERWHPSARAAVGRQREAVARLVESTEAVAIAGGHVAILLDRLRLFGVGALLAGKPLIAWSAGAMATARRVVLFHDMPPQGAGNAEVLESGLGLYPGVLPFPHARHRLRLGDPARVGELARRFSPDACVAMDEGAWMEWTPDTGWRAGAEGAGRLGEDGTVGEVVVC